MNLNQLRKAALFFQHAFTPSNQLYERYQFCAIRGFVKSGTNWLGNLLSLHPSVAVSGEFPFVGISQAKADYLAVRHHWGILAKPHLKGMFEKEFERFIKTVITEAIRYEKPLARVSWICDKTPGPVRPELIPFTKTLYIVRDVRDVVVSRAYHVLRGSSEAGVQSFPKMLEKYRQHNGDLSYFGEHPQELLDDEKWVMATVNQWNAQVSDAIAFATQESAHILLLRYEDLHRDVEGQRRRCYEFLGLNAEQSLALDSGPIKTSPGFKQENLNAFYRKGKVGDWETYMPEQLNQKIQENCKVPLEAFGYE